MHRDISVTLEGGELPEEEECKENGDCGAERACIGQRCQDPCSKKVCAESAQCKVIAHHPVCACQEGLSGNPRDECVASESHYYLL